MSRRNVVAPLVPCLWLVLSSAALGQPRPYIGYVYPAGGQQGTTVQIRLGGQQLDEVRGVLVTGAGVQASVVEYRRRLNPQENQLLREQLRELKKTPSASAGTGTAAPASLSEEDRRALGEKIQERLAEYVQPPACAAIASIVIAKVTLAKDASPGARELRLVTRRGVTNPLVFQVGQTPEVRRKPMISARIQVLGKEELALRKRPDDEIEQTVILPCTVNGQIASGEVNRYRFTARKGQRLVFVTSARSLIPYIADAVPGWFQPVLTVYDSSGKEVAYDDDERFKPDPVILFEVPRDGEYTFTITDALYRGREDFVYRVTVGELPYLTSIFPLGARVGKTPAIKLSGWDLGPASRIGPAPDAAPGIWSVEASRAGVVSNAVPFALDVLPEAAEREPNDAPPQARQVKLPVIINGRIDKPDDLDMFSFEGKAGRKIVVDVVARRLDSSLDSLVKLTGPDEKLLAYNDDHEDPGSGVNTHHADSYLLATLPADGTYRVTLADAAQGGGEAYAYRLRISPPRPDFALRVVPSALTIRAKTAAALTVHAIRKDGFAGPIKLVLKDPPEGFTAQPVSIAPGKDVATLRIRTTLTATEAPVSLHVQGVAQIGGGQVEHEAVPAEDRMQAFLWRHLVPASELWVTVFDPAFQPPPRRVCKVAIPPPEAQPAEKTKAGEQKPKFTKKQVAGRLRQLKLLFEDGLITDDLYARKVAECEAVQ